VSCNCKHCSSSLFCSPEKDPILSDDSKEIQPNVSPSNNAASFLVALTGQPNVGKSTLFNAMTGVRQFVANYPGVTVEKRTGIMDWKKARFSVVDLPGTYSLTSYSLEERVAVDFLLTEPIDLIVQVIDASNLIRSLYLTFQLLELERPVLIALNMMDIARSRGMVINRIALSEELKVPVIPLIANRVRGIDDLKEGIFNACRDNPKPHSFHVDYGKALETMIQRYESAFKEIGVSSRLPYRWLAIKMLEDDPGIRHLLSLQEEDENNDA
jgi:ferrous iron transport protein B